MRAESKKDGDCKKGISAGKNEQRKIDGYQADLNKRNSPSGEDQRPYVNYYGGVAWSYRSMLFRKLV